METNLRTRCASLSLMPLLLIAVLFLFGGRAFAQSATSANPIGVGRTACTFGTSGVQNFTYNGTTRTLANSGAACVPALGAPGFSRNLAGLAFNPADQLMYYVRTIYSSGVPTTYVWRWNPRTCPTGSPAPAFTYTNTDIAGLVFDRSGLGYWIEFTGAAAPYNVFLRTVNFATNTLGAIQPVTLTAGKRIYNLFGDVVLTPSGIMMFSFDNKLFTLNYKNYGMPGSLTGTYVDTVRAPGAGLQMVGLAYADGKIIAAYNGATCPYREINIVTGDTLALTYGGTFSTYDFTNVAAGIGASKKLVSSAPAGLNYNLVYEIKVKNLGNVPDSNVQVTDDLGAVFGVANVTVTGVTLVTAPPGVTLNAGYNGRGANNLLNPSCHLLNFPLAQDSIVIRINCTVSGIIPGVVYNNNATVTCTSYKGVALRDVSTDGDNPDLNSNDKADDTGEAQPTPFYISVASETPPCDTLTRVLYRQDFGTGGGMFTAMPGTSRTQYTGTITQPIPAEGYAITNDAWNGNNSRWIFLNDHTGNANGRMMVVNADVLPNKIFFDSINILCSSVKHSLSIYTAFLGNSTYQTVCNGFGGFKYPNLILLVRNATNGRIIANLTTGEISSNAWSRFGMKFVMPAGVTRIVLEIYNTGEGGCGNDIALDDIEFGQCDPEPEVTVTASTAGCLGSNSTFAANMSDPTVIFGAVEYQWQVSSDSISWTDISSATSPFYVIGSTGAGDVNKYYRVMVAAFPNITNPTCRYVSPGFFLGVKTPSVAPTSARASKGTVCPGDPVTLSVNGGSLGTGAVWEWFQSSCGGAFLGTGTTITVNPTFPTVYYVRARGDCNTTACVQVTVNISCDIDDDDDGIPDLVENAGTDVEGDSDFDGVLDWRDADFPGFVDTNSDGVNDNFDKDRDGIINQYDLDSDNDGIPDTVESGGVDTNGDGRIDNYTDTDGDGFSQNVDANGTGKAASGNGLDRIDAEGDGIPNFLDTDSDNDGIPDVVEAGGTDANNDGRIDGYTDTDNDGYSDNVDSDVGNDGTAEGPTKALLRTGIDADNNGRTESYPYNNMDNDGRANPYDLDSDGDGITDVREAGFGDVNFDGFSDGSKGSLGWDVNIDALATLNLPNTDGNGRPNYLDIDADDDGITDNIEGLATLAYLKPNGTDGDNDGLDDSYDDFGGTFRGRGITPTDHDADTAPDYIDLDTDGDGQADRIEGNDFNSNQLPDDVVSLLGTDADGDGLDDRFDLDNAGINHYSARMGNGGSFTGYTPAGTRSTVQRSWPTATDRDWRYVQYLLPAEVLEFTGNLQGANANLLWSIRSDISIGSIEVQRSLDGVTFNIVGTVAGKAALAGEKINYNFTDNVTGINNRTLYYRIRVIAANGRSKISDVILLKPKGILKSTIALSPNPASNQVVLNFTSAQATTAEIRLIDGAGKMVAMYKKNVLAGSNAVPITGLDRFSDGIYHLQIKWEQELVTEKLVIKK
jgi:uncharacterized repeat protein (TIGR01451 family)